MAMDQRQDRPLRIISACEFTCTLICGRCWKYVSRSDAPPEELDQLIRHLVELYGGLNSWSMTLIERTDIPHIEPSGLSLLYACELTFERILDAFDRSDAAILEQSDPTQYGWPFPKRKTLQWASEVSRHKERLSSLVNQTFTSRMLSGTSNITNGDEVKVNFNSMLSHLGERWKAWKKMRKSYLLLQRVHDMADLIALSVNQTDSTEITTARYEGMQVLSLAIIIENERFIDVCLEKFDTVDIRDDSTVANTPLELAVEHGLARRIFRKMLTKSQAPHAKNTRGWSPIHTACERGHLHVVEELLDAGVDVNLEGYEGMTPLLKAVANQQPSIVKLLLSRGANIHAVNKHNWNSCHFAAKHGDLDIMELLRETEIDWNWGASAALDRVWHSNMRPIHLATCAGAATAVLCLINHSLIDNLNCATKEGLTATHFAVIQNRVEILGYLLSVGGADPNRAWLSPWPTPLHLAAKFGLVKIAEALLASQADVFAMSELGLTAEDIADQFKNSDVKELLRKHRLNSTDEAPAPKYLCDVPKENGTLKLLRCISKGTLDACKNAISEGADLNLCHLHSPEMQSICCTPLLNALNRRRPNVAKLLIVSGATIQGRNCKNITTHFGYTTIHLAARFGYTDVLRLLLARQSELEPTLELCPVHPIHLAIAFSKRSVVRALLGVGSRGNETMDDQVSTISSQSLRNPEILSRRHSSSPGLLKHHRPVYPLISLDHIEKETLEYYGLPWQYDKHDSSYVVILRELDDHETDVLFEHTQRLRQRRTTKDTIEKETTKRLATVHNSIAQDVSGQIRNIGDTKSVKAHPLAILSVREIPNDDTFDFEPFPILHSTTSLRSGSSASTLYCGSALHIACTAGNEELALLLTDEAFAPVDILDVNLMTPLLRAADYGHISLIDQLLARGANLEARNDVLETALLIAADTGDLPTVQHLASAHAADPFARSAVGVSGLLRAAEQDHAPMLAFFVGLGAAHSPSDAASSETPRSSKDKNGKGSSNADNDNDNSITVLPHSESVLRASFFAGGVTACTYLLNARAIDLAATNPSSGSALHVACAFVHVSSVRRILRLLTAGETAAALRLRAGVGGTPLYVAAASGNVDTVGILLRAGAEVDAVGGEEGTAVMVAARYGRIGVVRLLLEYGASVGCVGDGGVVRSLWDAAAGEGRGEQAGKQGRDESREPGLALNDMRRWLLVGRFVEAPRLLRAV